MESEAAGSVSAKGKAAGPMPKQRNGRREIARGKPHRSKYPPLLGKAPVFPPPAASSGAAADPRRRLRTAKRRGQFRLRRFARDWSSECQSKGPASGLKAIQSRGSPGSGGNEAGQPGRQRGDIGNQKQRDQRDHQHGKHRLERLGQTGFRNLVVDQEA